ncbi:MAG: class I SAM-dependent methyltransferase [Eubacteriales bacterium]|nr:class I SAM-dependent methyltransferase [Eubacteriales bacterium]MDD3073234.1 class I SAM-dependent methyltransferase [Eubacteriales bacterium]MDD4079191.1 class I SAM-dependent methyltransferase [Eubacteriales bacterium]MDD4769140.1 class I SAM-dependent methyltransferase [Eubacteriales bacterium]
MDLYQWAVAGLDLDGKTILDAATGAGEATLVWAEYIHKHNMDARIISVDIDQPQEWIDKIRGELGELQKYVELIQANIFQLDFLGDASIDVVNCDSTIVFLNPHPLKLLTAFKEFHRVLKPGGKLVIVSEFPPENTPQTQGQWQRWNLAKAIWALNAETWSAEPRPEEVESALNLLGFADFQCQCFPGYPIRDFQACIDEWGEMMLEKISELEWPQLKQALSQQVQAVKARISEEGFMLPDQYVLKCIKKLG